MVGCGHVTVAHHCRGVCECSCSPQHGRLKVRTSEEQAAAKRREREKQVKEYRETMTSIFQKVVPLW